jgi:hypothetical protein
MTDSLRRGDIDFKAKALLNTYVKSVEISETNKERTLLEIPFRPRVLSRGSRLKIPLTSSFIIFGFIYRALLFYSGLIRFNRVLDNKGKNFLIRISVRI